ncbi:16S rRNA (guanine(527)-N(7))-methyltransferase RsmG [Yoonia sp. 2307UL14-13]|uniref:16S rRNA (guanine(527)-N(7))-methyltransferase RsmG n=1 Tax=Yoonia sp. 2307UL14-13 TaxID=3126506 RepID=UPI0030B44654
MPQEVGGVDVSRETLDRLIHFSNAVEKWTKKINLIAPGTIHTLWERHVIDSAQIFAIIPNKPRQWLDIGSGGGFPGLVIAILAKQHMPSMKITLIESDQRKTVFLRSVARDLDLPCSVIAQRIEKVPAINADIVSARALTSLLTIMPLLHRHLEPDGTALLHKGKRYRDEIAVASKSWSFDLEDHPSLTDPDARLLAIHGISPIG